MKKALSLFLALVLVLSLFAFAGCSGDDPKQTKTKESVKTTEAKSSEDTRDPNTVLDHEVKDLHDHDFLFIVRTVTSKHIDTHEIYADGLTGDKINDAVFTRNSALEARLHCTISEVRTAKPCVEYKEALVAGEYVADFFFDPIEQQKNIMNSSLLTNLLELENFHPDKVWYDQGFIKGLTVDGKLFGVTGDAATLDDRSCWIMFFNRKIVSDCVQTSTSGLFDGYKDTENCEGFYKFINDGKWTAEAMYELMIAGKEDKDGNGSFDVTNDIFGYIGENANNYFHLLACGVGITQYTSEGEWALPDTLPENVLQAWTDLKPVLTSEYRLVADTGSAFRSGHTVFFACNLGSVLNYTSDTVDFGLCPLPKANVNQDCYYAAPSQFQLGMFSIPQTVSKAEDAEDNGFADGREQAAYFLEEFSYYSMDTLTYAFYDQVVSKQLLQDSYSRDILALALEHKMIDPAFLFTFGNLQLAFQEAASPYGAGSRGSDINYESLESKYETRLGTARSALQTWRQSIDDPA